MRKRLDLAKSKCSPSKACALLLGAMGVLGALWAAQRPELPRVRAQENQDCPVRGLLVLLGSSSLPSPPSRWPEMDLSALLLPAGLVIQRNLSKSTSLPGLLQ